MENYQEVDRLLQRYSRSSRNDVSGFMELEVKDLEEMKDLLGKIAKHEELCNAQPLSLTEIEHRKDMDKADKLELMAKQYIWGKVPLANKYKAQLDRCFPMMLGAYSMDKKY